MMSSVHLMEVGEANIEEIQRKIEGIGTKTAERIVRCNEIAKIE